MKRIAAIIATLAGTAIMAVPAFVAHDNPPPDVWRTQHARYIACVTERAVDASWADVDCHATSKKEHHR